MLKELINEKWKEAFKARDLEKRTAYELIKQRITVAVLYCSSSGL